MPFSKLLRTIFTQRNPNVQVMFLQWSLHKQSSFFLMLTEDIHTARAFEPAGHYIKTISNLVNLRDAADKARVLRVYNHLGLEIATYGDLRDRFSRCKVKCFRIFLQFYILIIEAKSSLTSASFL